MALFDFLMIFTILYWHTLPEKILGALVGVTGYVICFNVMRFEGDAEE